MGKLVDLVESTLVEDKDTLSDGAVVRITDERVLGKKNTGRYFTIKHFKDKYIFILSNKSGKELKPVKGVGGAVDKSKIHSDWDFYKENDKIVIVSESLECDNKMGKLVDLVESTLQEDRELEDQVCKLLLEYEVYTDDNGVSYDDEGNSWKSGSKQGTTNRKRGTGSYSSSFKKKAHPVMKAVKFAEKLGVDMGTVIRYWNDAVDKGKDEKVVYARIKNKAKQLKKG